MRRGRRGMGVWEFGGMGVRCRRETHTSTCARAAMVMLALLLAVPALASDQAEDDASAAVYDDGWVTGDNGGSGFGPWTIRVETNSGACGRFIADTNANSWLNFIQSGDDGKAWGLYANTTGVVDNFQQVVAFRGFTAGPLHTSQTFTISMEHGYVDNTGTVGFVLRTGNVTTAANDYNTGSRFEWGFVGGSNNYFIVDATSQSNQFDTGVPYTTNGLRLALTLLSSDTYTLEVVNVEAATTNGFSRQLSASGGIASFAIYNRDVDVSGEQGNAYFNLAGVSAKPASSYRLATVAVDAGGRRVTNDAMHVIDASLGGIFGYVTNDSRHVAKNGYAGQLYDLAGIDAYAEPSTIDEGDTRPLGARYEYDDQTVSELESDPDWTIVDGPLESISGGGLATASNVYVDMTASAQAEHKGYSDVVDLLVLNTLWDNWAPLDGDGVNDGWQAGHFAVEDYADAMGDQDPDTDGRNNLMEWITGTIPTNDESFFAMWVERVDGVSTQADIKFDPTYTTRIYTVKYCDDIAAADWLDLAQYEETTNGTERTVRDVAATNENAYYRVLVELDSE